MCREPESNWRHQVFQTCALPTELSRQVLFRQGLRTVGASSGDWPTFGPHHSRRLGFTSRNRCPSADCPLSGRPFLILWASVPLTGINGRASTYARTRVGVEITPRSFTAKSRLFHLSPLSSTRSGQDLRNRRPGVGFEPCFFPTATAV